MTAWPIELYAILSADDCIADANGTMPGELMNDADWQYFQGELDSCAIVVLGRRSHEAAPNSAGRRRIVMTSGSGGLESRDGACWWNPARISLDQMLTEIVPDGGKVGVPGGQQVFEYFLHAGFDRFHLSRAANVRLPGGTRAFSSPGTAEDRLRLAGLVPGAERVIDPEAQIVLTIWDRKEDNRWQF
jgi:dihydrofolate reductase